MLLWTHELEHQPDTVQFLHLLPPFLNKIRFNDTSTEEIFSEIATLPGTFHMPTARCHPSRTMVVLLSKTLCLENFCTRIKPLNSFAIYG